jgi:CO/xanthine dehydrogenase Mo-binding subunit
MVPAAIGNVVCGANGVRVCFVPFTPAKVLAAIKET